MEVDPETLRALAKLAKVQERSRAAVVRKLVKDAARELNGSHPALAVNTQALAPKLPAMETAHDMANT